jgi:type III secretion protein S
MTSEFILIKVNEALMTVLLMSAPVLILTVVVGVLTGLIQALTQIQDQTLPLALKLCVVLLVLIFLGPWLGSLVAHEASALLDGFPAETR